MSYRVGMGSTPESAADARTAYAAARLMQRRSVRLALALGGGLRHGPRAARELLGAGAAQADLPGPELLERCRYPELRVAHLGTDPVTRGVIPGVHLRPDTWRTIVRRDRPDLLLVDAVEGWDAGELQRLTSEVAVPLVVDDHLLPRVATTPSVRKRAIALLDGGSDICIDDRKYNPIGAPATPSGRIRTLPSAAASSPASGVGEADEERGDVLRSGGGAHEVRSLLEHLARGTVVVAPRGTGRLEERLGPLADHLLTEHDTVDQHAAMFLDGERWERTSVRARRHVQQTYGRAAFVTRLLERCGIGIDVGRTISVLLCTRRSDHLASALDQIRAQTYPDVEIVLGLHGIDAPSDRLLDGVGRPLRLIRVSEERPLGAVLNAALDQASGRLIAKMDDDDLYGPNHLDDLVVALGYSRATMVGRWSTVTYIERDDQTVHSDLERQERWATHLPGATTLIHGDVLRRLRWRQVPNAVDTELVRTVVSDGGGVYSTHRFGFVRRRHGDHTFVRPDRSFRGQRSTPGLDRTVLDV